MPTAGLSGQSTPGGGRTGGVANGGQPQGGKQASEAGTGEEGKQGNVATARHAPSAPTGA